MSMRHNQEGGRIAQGYIEHLTADQEVPASNPCAPLPESVLDTIEQIPEVVINRESPYLHFPECPTELYSFVF